MNILNYNRKFIFIYSGLVVVDEIHILGEGKRGANLETLLCKLLLTHPTPRIVAMSATIGNINEIEQFLKVHLCLKKVRNV
jgi:replicative superfamily II helicase